MDKIICTYIIGGQLGWKNGRKKGHKKAKNGSYVILIEQQVQHHKNVNDVI